MKKVSFLFCAMVFTLLATSCKKNSNSVNTPTVEPKPIKKTNFDAPPKQNTLDIKEMAQELCTCMQPMVDLTAKIAELKSATDEEKQALKIKINETNKMGQECISSWEDKYMGHTEKNDNLIKIQMRELCPDAAALLNE